MSERLTDEELDALIARFSPGRHPKVAAALAELKVSRLHADFYARSIKGLLPLLESPELLREAGIVPGGFVADAVPYLVSEIGRLREQLEREVFGRYR